MSIKQRLGRLESAIDDRPTLSAAACQMLVSLAARADALFWPVRAASSAAGELINRRAAYHAGRRGVAARADGAGEWKQAHTVRQELIAAELVKPCRANSEIASLIPLPLGFATVAALVGELLELRRVSPFLFQQLRELPPSRTIRGTGWTSEADLLGVPGEGDPSDWDGATDAMLPLLVANVAESHHDMLGRVYYRATADTLPALPAVPFSPMPGAEELYMATIRQEIVALSRLESSCDIVIPLPATD